MKLARAYAKRLVVANWKGIIFHSFDLDRHVTGLEGQNGAGKTTVMAAYMTAILPNQRLLSFRNLNGNSAASRGDAGLWGRLGEGGVSYTLIEWVTPRGKRLWAGVALTRGMMPSIDIKPFVIHDLHDGSPYDVLLLRENGVSIVPPVARLREHIAMHGGRLEMQKTIADYMKVLFDHGITPMPMTNHDEQERFYRVLSTSMEGSALATLIKTGLREYLLSPDSSLERRIVLMRESLEQCRQTKRELERAQAAHAEISALFDAAWKMSSFAYFGARGRLEQEAKNWREHRTRHSSLKEQCRAHETAVAALYARVDELRRQLSIAQGSVEPRRAILRNVENACALREQLESASGEQRRLQSRAEQLQERRDAAQQAEQETALALQAAQGEYTRLADELGDAQKAVESLIRRVTELHVARTLLADAQKAMQPERLERATAPALKQRVDQLYAEETRRQTDAQAELDALDDHLARHGALLGWLRALALAEQLETPDADTAYEQALAFDVKLRERHGLAERIPSLQSDLAQVRVNVLQQAEIRVLAAELGVADGAGLAAALATVHTQLEQIEADQDSLNAQLKRARDDLLEAQGRLPALQDRVRRCAEARNWRAQLGAVCPEWASLPTSEALASAVEAGRGKASRTDERRRIIELRLYEMSERIRSLEHDAGLLDPRLGAVAEHVEGRLLATRFDELPVHEAATAQARLGGWSEAIVVAAPEHAARQAADLSDRPDTLRFVSERALHAVQQGGSLEDSELILEQVNGERAARLTRRPAHPVLGRRARELEATRLRAERDDQQGELAQLRETSRLLKQAIKASEHLLALGPVVWLADPEPLLLTEQAHIRHLTEAGSELQGRLAGLRETALATRRRRQRLAGLDEGRHLLDPPDYVELLAQLEGELQRAYAARAWVAQHGATVRKLMEGLPILASGAGMRRRPQLLAALERYRRTRERLAHQREALARLLTVIGHLDQEEDEKTYRKKTSIITKLQAQLEPAKTRMNGAASLLQDSRTEFDGARAALADAAAALATMTEKCRALDASLTECGARGTPEELALAREAVETAAAAAADLAVEYEKTNVAHIEQRTTLKSLQENVLAQMEVLSQQLSTLRFERRAQRELDRVVGQLGLRGRIDSELNRQQHFPTGSLISAFQSSQSQQVLLLDRLKPWPDVLLDLKRIEGFSETIVERRAIQTLRAWERVRVHLEQRTPRNLTMADDPLVALAQMTEKMNELNRTLEAQEEDMRTRSSGLADGIAARQRSAKSLVMRLNRDLAEVSFGSIRGLQITVSYPEDMVKMLDCLRQDRSLSLFDSGEPLEDTLAKLYERETGGAIKGARLFDYRNYLQLRLEIRRINGKWEATSDVSTGEAIGAGAAVLVMIMRTWNEEANRISGSAGYAMQQILLDEANRLDEQALDTLAEFCRLMDVQALVAAPGLDKPRRSTVFQLSRSLRANEEFVSIRGTRIRA